LTVFCFQAYYGGEARCDVEMGENFNPEELVCGGCSDIAKAQVNKIICTIPI
jgi:RCR-type E3 ubiquitin transferase